MVIGSKLFFKKIITDTLKLRNVEWYEVAFRYMIDSVTRKRVQVTQFLKDQLNNPPVELAALAIQLRGSNDDETIINILKWVKENITYKTDIQNFKKNEYWATALETYQKKIDDCDGQNGLIYVLARLAGISPMKIYCSIGDTASGGHFWCIYISSDYDKVVSIDATYYPSLVNIKSRKRFELNDRYTSIWYIFNESICLKPTEEN